MEGWRQVAYPWAISSASWLSKSQNVITMLPFVLELLDQSPMWTNKKALCKSEVVLQIQCYQRKKAEETSTFQNQMSVLWVLYSFSFFVDYLASLTKKKHFNFKCVEHSPVHSDASFYHLSEIAFFLIMSYPFPFLNYANSSFFRKCWSKSIPSISMQLASFQN